MNRKMRSILGQFDNIPGYVGHTHFWERLTRRQFLVTATGALGLALGSSSWMPKLAEADLQPVVLPNPIPGGKHFLEIFFGFPPPTELFHVLGPSVEPSTITDFHGFVGAANVTGNVKQIDVNTGATTLRFFDNDMRFMKGHYIGVDGEEHNGTFGLL